MYLTAFLVVTFTDTAAIVRRNDFTIPYYRSLNLRNVEFCNGDTTVNLIKLIELQFLVFNNLTYSCKSFLS